MELPISVTYSTDQFGRVFTGIEISSTFVPVLYMIDSQDAFVVGQLPSAAIFGEFDAQSQPTSFTTHIHCSRFSAHRRNVSARSQYRP